MVQLNFDARAVQPNIGFEPVPSGPYHVRIVDSVDKPNSKGTGSYLELKMQITQGEYAGKFLYDRLNLNNPNQQAVDIAHSTLSAICHVTGIMQCQDSRQLHDRAFQVVVSKTERNDMPGSGVMSNHITSYRDSAGNLPGQAGAVAQPQAQPAWAQQQYTPTAAPAPQPAYTPNGQQAPQQPAYPQQAPVAPAPAPVMPQPSAAPQYQQPQQAPQPQYAPQPNPAPMAPATAPPQAAPPAGPYPSMSPTGAPPWVAS
jgi:hypothetical protein